MTERAHLTPRLSGVAAGLVLVFAVTGAIELLKPHVPVLSLGVLYIFAVLPVAVVWGLAYAVAVSVASMLAFNFFFLSRCTRSRSRTRATGSRWSCSSSRRSSSASSRPGRAGERARRRCSPRSRRRCSSTGRSAPSWSGSRPRRRGRCSAERARIALGDRRPAEARIALAAGGRRVGTIQLEGAARPMRARAGALLPALASLLGVAVDRERLDARGARGGGAAPRRRDEDGAAAGGQPRPAHAADGDLDLGGRARAAGPRARARTTATELLETILGAADRLDHLVGEPARPLAAAGRGGRAGAASWSSSTSSSLQALDELGARRRARRGVAARTIRPRSRVDAAPDPARARQPDRERAQVLAAGGAGARAGRREPRSEALVRVIDHGPGRRAPPSASGSSSRSTAARATGAARRRRPRARDRARLRRGERRPRLGRVAARAGRDVRARAARVATPVEVSA